MRLIDADAFEAYIKEHCKDSLVDLWCELVHRQPTAYDVDKVIEQLEEKVFELPIGGMAVSCLGRSVAIEIVRTGGGTVGETHTGTIHGPAGGRTGLKPPDPAGGRPPGEDGRKGVRGI